MTFEAFSVRPGELRYADLGRVPVNVDNIDVTALDGDGVAVTGTVHFTLKWGATGWQRLFACPLCKEPCRVLGIHVGVFSCQSCIPRRTRQQLHKNRSDWSADSGLVDRIVRTLTKLRPTTGSEQFLKDNVRRLTQRAAGQADVLVREAVRLCEAVDYTIEHGSVRSTKASIAGRQGPGGELSQDWK